MPKKDYFGWAKEDLIREIKKLEKRKKYGVVWEDTPEEVAELCKANLPVLVEDKDKAILTDAQKPINILIEGDNYHALSVLNYTHKGKIDIIYIDPPFNTGATNWKYNNDYVERDDQWRHSKWLSFMHKRLILAKKLLSKKGFLICAIDANELFSLGLLLDEIFGERNRVGLVTVEHNPKGRNLSKFFSENSEFMLVFSKDISSARFNDVVIDEDKRATFNLSDDQGNYRLEPFMRVRTSWSRKNKPKCYYPIYVSKDLEEITIENKLGYYEVFPRTKDGREWAWKNVPESFVRLNKNGYFVAVQENNRIDILHKYREKQVFKNVWTNKKYHSEFQGTNILKKILGDYVFEYPKSLYLVADIIKITSKMDSIILDFFAGSGTTGHAVFELNKEDKGTRKFILCTDNENNICTEVCYPRIKGVINGYLTQSKDKMPGVGGNLKYFKTAFVDAGSTDINKKKLVDKSTEMLCLKEYCFDEVKSGQHFKIFTNSQGKLLGIIYDDDGIEPFKKELRKSNKKFVVYVFSLDESAREEEFEDVESLVELKPIPAVILNVYKRILK